MPVMRKNKKKCQEGFQYIVPEASGHDADKEEKPPQQFQTYMLIPFHLCFHSNNVLLSKTLTASIEVQR
jgi:hypothetical protein